MNFENRNFKPTKLSNKSKGEAAKSQKSSRSLSKKRSSRAAKTTKSSFGDKMRSLDAHNDLLSKRSINSSKSRGRKAKSTQKELIHPT